MNNRIVNSAVKKVNDETIRGGFYVLCMVHFFASLVNAVILTIGYYPPPSCFNAELILRNRCFITRYPIKGSPPPLFPIKLTQIHFVSGFCTGVASLPLCLSRAVLLSLRKSYLMNCVRFSTLGFRIVKSSSRVLNGVDPIYFGVPRPADAKSLIINSEQNRLLWPAGIDPRRGYLAPVVLKTHGANNAIHAKRSSQLWYVLAVSAVEIGECVIAHQHKLIFSNLTLRNRRI